MILPIAVNKNIAPTTTNSFKKQEFYVFCREQFIEKYSNCEKEANRLLGLFENYKLGDANLICQLITSRPYSNMSQENIICYLARKLVLECLEKKTKRILKYYHDASQIINIFELKTEKEMLKNSIAKQCLTGIRSNQKIRDVMCFIREHNFNKERIASEVVNSLKFKEKEFEASEIKKFFDVEISSDKNEKLNRVVNYRLCRTRY